MTQKRDTRRSFQDTGWISLVREEFSLLLRECSGIFHDSCSEVHVGLVPSLRITWCVTHSVLPSGKSPDVVTEIISCLSTYFQTWELSQAGSGLHFPGSFASRWVHVTSFNQWNVSGHLEASAFLYYLFWSTSWVEESKVTRWKDPGSLNHLVEEGHCQAQTPTPVCSVSTK